MFVQPFKLYLCAVFFLMALSCEKPPEPVRQPSAVDDSNDSGRYSRTRRDRSEEARTRRHSCRNFGEQSELKCAQEEDCKDACNDLFPIKKYEDECLELPVELVYSFEELLYLMDAGK
ncbi:MAG: hypothetical protein OXB86_04115, partial [Bdellovibrionales bacterium]|nr:hypothetical protein [Bdellovibrionales bacterium]